MFSGLCGAIFGPFALFPNASLRRDLKDQSALVQRIATDPPAFAHLHRAGWLARLGAAAQELRGKRTLGLVLLTAEQK